MNTRVLICLMLTAPAYLVSAGPSRADELPLVRTHENRQPAGVLKNGTLVLNLRAARGLWRPEKESGPALAIEAFGERDGLLTAPAPLIRVPEGTAIVASVRNDLDLMLTVHGLCERNDTPCAPISVPAGGMREVKFRSGLAGTYGYWAETSGMPQALRFGSDTQLSGAFVVDPKTGPIGDDRVFVITEWSSLTHEQIRKAARDEEPFLAMLKALGKEGKATTLINGLSWPETERLTYRLGETVRWRFVNGSGESHPLHLHGFYFDVDSVGDGLRDTHYGEGQKKREVTHLLPVGATMTLTWKPERIGNWLFHCHFMEHVAPFLKLGNPQGHDPAHAAAGHAGHDDKGAGMAGMVMGITVIDPSGTSGDPLEYASVPPPTARKLTMTMKTAPNRYGKEPAYGFVLAENGSPATSPVSSTAEEVKAPGPTLVLKRDEPVEITLVNQLPEATAVHWHGMELDSYYDGVHGFGGIGRERTPMIAPGESFVVRFTPPRSGTFMYHTHVHDYRQLTAGLYGPMLVVDAPDAFDAETDHPLVIARDGVGPAPVMVLNGSTKPTFKWRAGARHRLRFANITRHDMVQVALRSDEGPIMWFPLTKDGAPVPRDDQAPRRAEQTIAVGETYDFEVVAPVSTHARKVWIELRDADGRWQVQGLAIIM
jgi:manganese oxidase